MSIPGSTTTPEPNKKKVKQLSKGDSATASQTNMSISNRLQQTMVREPNVKKQLRKSQEVMEQSTAKKPQNAYYGDDGVIYTGRASLPLNNRLDSQRESQMGSRGTSSNRQAVLEYIRSQEARMAEASQQNSGEER